MKIPFHLFTVFGCQWSLVIQHLLCPTWRHHLQLSSIQYDSLHIQCSLFSYLSKFQFPWESIKIYNPHVLNNLMLHTPKCLPPHTQLKLHNDQTQKKSISQILKGIISLLMHSKVFAKTAYYLISSKFRKIRNNRPEDTQQNQNS